MSNMDYFNYVVSFSDFVCKTGVTSKPFYRLQDFMQEAQRNRKRVIGFTVTPPSQDKIIALRIEAEICETYSYCAIEGHREWFFDAENKSKEYPDQLAFCVSFFLKQIWPREQYMWLLNSSGRRELWKHPSDLSSKYEKVIEFAEALGSQGDAISATIATALADGMVL